jgi:hypothetical protein
LKGTCLCAAAETARAAVNNIAATAREMLAFITDWVFVFPFVNRFICIAFTPCLNLVSRNFLLSSKMGRLYTQIACSDGVETIFGLPHKSVRLWVLSRNAAFPETDANQNRPGCSSELAGLHHLFSI